MNFENAHKIEHSFSFRVHMSIFALLSICPKLNMILFCKQLQQTIWKDMLPVNFIDWTDAS